MAEKQIHEMTTEEIEARYASRAGEIGRLHAFSWDNEALATLLIGLHHRLARLEKKLQPPHADPGADIENLAWKAATP
ncbi:MAG: hypothetical protein IH919_07390 [Deltaproteobacteria bacterium]|nr:hypothetical protein [Deltaproteobacteria bacterium]